jgi:biotin carboxyl carrier protein
LIIRVLKKEGDRVEAGEVILILAAMKMQSELRQ